MVLFCYNDSHGANFFLLGGLYELGRRWEILTMVVVVTFVYTFRDVGRMVVMMA